MIRVKMLDDIDQPCLTFKLLNVAVSISLIHIHKQQNGVTIGFLGLYKILHIMIKRFTWRLGQRMIAAKQTPHFHCPDGLYTIMPTLYALMIWRPAFPSCVHVHRPMGSLPEVSTYDLAPP